MTRAVLSAAGVLAVILGVRLGRRIILARRSGDGARLRFLVPQAAGLLLTSLDIIVRQRGILPGGARAVTGALFWAGLALVAYGLLVRFRTPGPGG